MFDGASPATKAKRGLRHRTINTGEGVTSRKTAFWLSKHLNAVLAFNAVLFSLAGGWVKIEKMLLAPQDPLRPSNASSSRPPAATREEANLNYALIALGAALLSYSLVAGFALANGSVPVQRAYLLMTPIPFVLALWHGFGAWRARFLELGLLLLCGGWGMLFLTLLLKHAGVQSALAQGLSVSQAVDSPLTWLCALLSLGLLVAGAWLCFQRWRGGAPSS